MQAAHKVSLMAALALCALPEITPAGEAPATSAASQEETEKKLADARQRLDAAAREVAELSGQLGRRTSMQPGGGPGGAQLPRALLGVGIGPGADRDGAHVMDVSPGGPAAEAGIKVGDVITGIADLDLTKDSNPGRALVEKMNQLEPDQKVKVAVLRDGKKLSFDIAPRAAPREASMRVFTVQNGMPGNPGMQGPPGMGVRVLRGTPGEQGPGGPPGGPESRQQMEGAVQWVQRALGERERGMRDGDESGARFDGAELASLSDRLGSYFGVSAGVLVVRAGVDSQFKLQDGDVILAIDGRATTTAQQAGRILRSYQPGEKLTLRVQRDRKAQNIEGTAPGSRGRD